MTEYIGSEEHKRDTELQLEILKKKILNYPPRIPKRKLNKIRKAIKQLQNGKAKI